MEPGAWEEDYLEELERLQASGLSTTELADALEQRAASSPPGSVSRSGFLNAAGDFWGFAEDTERAEAAFRAAIADAGDPDRYAVSALLLLLLQHGRDDEADAVLADLLTAARAATLSSLTYEMVGQALADGGRPREALRWFTMPLRDVDPDALDDDDLALLAGRYEVRRTLGLGEDRFDQVTVELRSALD
ncbi:hypothetical protein D9V37_03265 [Nocardioides mangrovicus]|uniref:Tetratricopeptide repeat protein n=1 Tax=Nocardioides mangrovicus TaxID=2478913 RepID=A0A3L8P766_9ACTN|nr:hypothetical protein [Nocardioides mangrovicus]RLV50964.1 hypothetical protein D9V37_03265 [Nocardioides mangrovicus]